MVQTSATDDFQRQVGASFVMKYGKISNHVLMSKILHHLGHFCENRNQLESKLHIAPEFRALGPFLNFGHA